MKAYVCGTMKKYDERTENEKGESFQLVDKILF